MESVQQTNQPENLKQEENNTNILSSQEKKTDNLKVEEDVEENSSLQNEDDDDIEEENDQVKQENQNEISQNQAQPIQNSNKIQQQKAKKMPWTEEEDRQVYELVSQYGPQKWTQIAQHIPGRIGKQCRERWHNHLNPEINKNQWSEEEEWVLFLLHRHKGNKWAELCVKLPGRTDNAIKNHWNSSMKKKIQDFVKRLQSIKENGLETHTVKDIYRETETDTLQKLLDDPNFEKYLTEPEPNNENTTKNRRKKHQMNPQLSQSLQLSSSQQQNQEDIDCNSPNFNHTLKKNNSCIENIPNNSNSNNMINSCLNLEKSLQESNGEVSNKENIIGQTLSRSGLNFMGVRPTNSSAKTDKQPQKRGRKPKKPLEQLPNLEHPNIKAQQDIHTVGNHNNSRYSHQIPQHMHGHPHMPYPSYYHHHPHMHPYHHYPHQLQHMQPGHHLHYPIYHQQNNHYNAYQLQNHQPSENQKDFDFEMQTPIKSIKNNDGNMLKISGNIPTTGVPPNSTPNQKGIMDVMNNFPSPQQEKGSNNILYHDKNNLFSSPKSPLQQQIVSPTKLLDLGTPDHHNARLHNNNEFANAGSNFHNSHPRSGFRFNNGHQYFNNSGHKSYDQRYCSPFYTKKNLENSFKKMYESGNKINNNISTNNTNIKNDVKVSLFQQN